MSVDPLLYLDKQKHLENIIDHLNESTSLYTGQAFLNQLVQSLSRLLRLDYVAIGESKSPMTIPGHHLYHEIQSISVSYKGSPADSFTYSLEGTPFENITDGRILSFEQEARRLFPRDKLMARHSIEAYAGIPLIDSRGKVIGLFLALHRKPFEDLFELRHVLKLFSYRAALELERIRYKHRMEILAYTDELTGLPNRNQFMEYFEDHLQRAKELKHKLGLLHLDIDRFKRINEMEGYEIGDRLLKMVAYRLKQFSFSDSMLARVGGDKFAVLLPHIEHKLQISEAAEALLQLLQRPFLLDDYEFYLRASIGASVFPVDGDRSRQLSLCADQAVNKAKKYLGNTYEFYTPQLDVHIANYANLEKKLYKALENEELSLHFQPQLDALSEQIIGWEALLRWTNEEAGSVSPAVFIPIIESTGLIIPIGYWIIEQACLKIKEWEYLYSSDVYMMINLSAYQLLHYNFPQKVLEIMQRTGVKAEQLGFEITENISLHGIDSALSVLWELKSLGLKLALDDFGTGYSALGYLKRFPIDLVKIDRSFVKDLTTDRHSLAICRSIIDVCHSLNFKVLAEGVEVEEQTELLRELGCDSFQGYFFSKPIPSAEVENFVRVYRQ